MALCFFNVAMVHLTYSWVRVVKKTFSSLSQLIFEGIRGYSYTGDIAIDDLKMLDGPCNQQGKDEKKKLYYKYW